MQTPMADTGGIREIVIVGGGTAGWMAAASLAHFLKTTPTRITLIESSEIGTVGVGEATIPPIMDFIRVLGLDEDQLIRRCNATFKLAIKFQDWGEIGHSFFHPFGQTGYPLEGVDFSAYWLSRFISGRAPRLEEYSLMAMASEAGRFSRPIAGHNSPLSQITYALHFDASLFAEFLKEFAMERGVIRIDAKISGTQLNSSSGFIESVRLDDGRAVKGDLFIDCSGFRGLLIEEALGTGYEDWRRWLPCDRAVAVQSVRTGPPAVHTLSIAREAGWQWRIPLQSRMGNGYVYCSEHIDDDAAVERLMGSLDEEAITPPRKLRFVAGMRKKFWNKNCVALGLASGFLEPLESTSIHLVQRGLALLLKLFPDREFSEADQDQYNSMLTFEYERIRDFILLHYLPTRRDDSEFWRRVRTIEPPESLERRIRLFTSHGRIFREENELFPVQSWLYIFMGQHMRPRRPDPMVDVLDPALIDANLEHLRSLIKSCVSTMPLHGDFVSAHCAAQSPAPALMT
jgi:tryptophan halogenase